MAPSESEERHWIKVGDDPLRYEYGRKNDHPALPAVKDQLAYVEAEKYSSYFHWETYTGHDKGAKPSVEEARKAAIEALDEEGEI